MKIFGKNLVNEGFLDLIKNVFKTISQGFEEEFQKASSEGEKQLQNNAKEQIKKVAQEKGIDPKSLAKLDKESNLYKSIFVQAVIPVIQETCQKCEKSLLDAKNIENFFPPEDEKEKDEWENENGEKLKSLSFCFGLIKSHVGSLSSIDLAKQGIEKLKKFENPDNPTKSIEGIYTTAQILEDLYKKAKSLNKEMDPGELLNSLEKIKALCSQIAQKILAQAKAASVSKKEESYTFKFSKTSRILGENMENVLIKQVMQQIFEEGIRLEELGILEDYELNLVEIQEALNEGLLTEAKYRGREVPLGKPMKGDVAKFKVYVKDPKTGNVKKVNFGSKTMEIRRDNPKARKSFRARHGCGKKRSSDRTKAAYWSCRMWSKKSVSKILGGK